MASIPSSSPVRPVPPPGRLRTGRARPGRPSTGSRAGRLVSAVVGIGLAAALATSAAPPAQALSAVSHGIGYASSGDGRWLGSYRLDDGRLGFCIDVGLAAPPGHEYAPVDDAGRSPDDRARLAYISRRWAGSDDPDTAAAGQLATWSITGLGGHDLSWYAARAGGRAGIVEGRAHDMLAEAASAAGASRSVAASVSLALGDDGHGSVRADLRADFLATGPADVPAGSDTGTVTLEGAVFADGSATAHVRNGVETPLTATGSTSALHVVAHAAFADLPYGAGLDVVGDGGASQGMILSRPADARADAQAEATAPSPLPFAPRVVTRASRAVATAGSPLSDRLLISAASGRAASAGEPTTADGWGLVREPDGSLGPVQVTVRSRLLGPFPEQVGPERQDAPEHAPQVCEVRTTVDHGPGEYTTPSCALPAGGFYTWVESISPDDTPASGGRDRVLPWRSTFGAATETAQVPQPPTITTTIGAREITAGGCATDTLHVSSFTGVGPVPVRVRLVGPLTLPPADGAPVDAPDPAVDPERTAEVQVVGDGDVSTPCLRVDAPGWYVAVLDSPGRPAADADGAAIEPFSDLVAHADETFHVGPPPSGAAPPPPTRTTLAMTGGAPGIDLPGHIDGMQLGAVAGAVIAAGASCLGIRRAGRRRGLVRARASRWARS